MHSWVTRICTHGYFKFKMLYLDLCGFQPPGDSEPWVKNSRVLKYLWVHVYLEVLTGTQDIKLNFSVFSYIFSASFQ